MFSIYIPKNEPVSIYGVFRLLYIVSRLFGFFPFTVKTESNGERKVYFTFINFIVFAVHVSIYSCFAYINIFYNLIENSLKSALLVLGIRIGVVFGLINSIAFLFGDLCNRHRILNIFKLCQEFDVQVYSGRIKCSILYWIINNISDAVVRFEVKLQAEQAMHLHIFRNVDNNSRLLCYYFVLDLPKSLWLE